MLSNSTGTKTKNISKTFLFLIFLLLLLFSLCGLCVLAVDWPEGTSLVQKWINHSRFLSDSLLLAGIATLMHARHGWIRVTSYAVAFIGTLFLFSQYLSFSYSRDFIPLVAIENVALFEMIDYGKPLIAFIIFLCVFALGIILFEKSQRTHMSFVKRYSLSLLMIVLSIGLINDHKWLSLDTIGNRDKHFRSGSVLYPHSSPIYELVTVFIRAYEQNRSLRALSATENMLTPEELEFVGKHSISWGEVDPEYPLMQYTDLPHPVGMIQKPSVTASKPNLIVFFVEGLSARLIQPYSQKFPGITPNIEGFSKQSVVVKHYFNHTFATYRGLSSGHCSIYSHGVAIESTDYRCMPHILNDAGYRTEFYHSQRRDRNYLDELLTTVGVSNVFAFEELVTKVTGQGNSYTEENYPYSSLTDNHLMQTFIGALREKEASLENHNDAKQPFYMGMYNIETHSRTRPFTGLSTYPHKAQEPANYIIDTVHNFDGAFGEFWDYFKNSSFADNTIVVLTTDHARFPEEDYISLWERDDYYMPFFSDRVPLIIHSPLHQKDPDYFIKTSSSLDLAPSLLHLMGIFQFENHFLGNSIFHNVNRMLPMAMGGHYMMYIYAGNMHILDETEKNKNYHLMQRIVERTRVLEKTNRLWRKK